MGIFSKIADFVNPDRVILRESLARAKREEARQKAEAEEKAKAKVKADVQKAFANMKEESKSRVAYPRSTVTYPVKSSKPVSKSTSRSSSSYDSGWPVIVPMPSVDAGTPAPSFGGGGGDYGGGGASASSCGSSSSCGGSSCGGSSCGSS